MFTRNPEDDTISRDVNVVVGTTQLPGMVMAKAKGCTEVSDGGLDVSDTGGNGRPGKETCRGASQKKGELNVADRQKAELSIIKSVNLFGNKPDQCNGVGRSAKFVKRSPIDRSGLNQTCIANNQAPVGIRRRKGSGFRRFHVQLEAFLKRHKRNCDVPEAGWVTRSKRWDSLFQSSQKAGVLLRLNMPAALSAASFQRQAHSSNSLVHKLKSK